MKSRLSVIVMLCVWMMVWMMVTSALADTKIQAPIQAPPEYKIEDLALTQTVYVEVETGRVLVSPEESRGQQYCVSKKYVGNEIVFYEIFVSGKKELSFSTGEEFIYPPYKNHRLYYRNFLFVDYVDKNGKDGADGVYEKIYPY